MTEERRPLIPGAWDSPDSYWGYAKQRQKERKYNRKLHLASKAYNDANVLSLTIRKRERVFVDLLFPRVVFMMKKLSKAKVNRDAMIGAGLSVLNESGYRTPVYTKDGNFHENAVKKVDELLGLPRVQNAMEVKFNEIEFDETEANTIVRDMVRSDIAPKDKLAFIKLYYELTGKLGKSANVNITNNNLNAINAPAKVWDQDAWSVEPKMVVSPKEDK